MTDSRQTQTGGRSATTGHIVGDCALAVGATDKETPEGRSWRLLSDLARLETGHTPSRRKPEYWNGDIPWIGIRDATRNHGRTLLDTEQHVTQAGIDNSSARLLPANTVCLSRTASVGYVVVMGRPMATSQDFVNWVCDPEKLDYRYLKYVLLAERASYSRFSHGTTHQTIYFPEVKAFHLLAPEIDMQAAIADVLSALDDKIEQNRRTARALERLARAIFRAWFVDFEPVKAKAAGATAFPSMPQEVFDDLPASFVDSDIGPVPEGWAVGVISDLASLSKTQAKPQESPEEVFDHFSIPAFDADKRPVVEPGAGIKSSKFLVVEGCVLLSKLNPRIARVWLPFVPSDRRQIASTEFLVFVPRHHTDRHYLYCQFQQTTFREELAQGASGTSNSHQRVRPNDVLQRSIVVPPPSARKGLARIVDPLFALVAASRLESSNLAEMRDYLLPKLLSGQVRVEAAHG